MTRVRVTDNFDRYLTTFQRAASDGLRAVAVEASERAAASMPGAGAAAAVPAGGTRLEYVSSDAGRPPGVRTGNLKNSMGFARIGPLSWAMGTSVRYGFWLERGTSRMRPRPFIVPAVTNNRRALQDEFVRAASARLARDAI